MNNLPRPATPNRNDTKTLLATLRWTTAIGAVSLTLAGWGLLSQAEALNAAKIDANAAASAAAEVAGSSAGAVLALATSATDNSAASSITAITASAASAASAATATPAAAAILLPTPTPTPAATATAIATATATATAVPATATPTAAPAKLYTLDVVQWVQNSSGEQWALVKDAAGTLWYIYGPDVERMEYGLEPEYQPQPANVTGTAPWIMKNRDIKRGT